MNWFKVFKSFRDEMTLNTWCFFNLNDHPDHTKFFMEKINVRYSLNGALGVFGPMFQISNTALTLIDQKFDLTKLQQFCEIFLPKFFSFIIFNTASVKFFEVLAIKICLLLIVAFPASG